MIIFAIFFVLIILISAYALFRQQEQNDQLRSFSIIIACRNEEKNIPGLIENLKRLEYADHLFEIIIADDASTDDTWQLLQRKSTGFTNLKLIRLPEKSEEYMGKKAALRAAAKQARNDYLLYTDADCRLPTGILQSYSRLLTNEIGAVTGWYITYHASALQRIIDIATAYTFAVTTRLGIAFSASGMNWLIKRSVFEASGGYEKIKDKIAGDDKLLLLQAKKAGARIGFNFSSPVKTVLESGKQTQRLARKYGKFGSSPFVIKTGMILLALFYLILPVWSFINGYELFLIYLAGLYILWLIVLLRFKLRFKIIDLAVLIAIPYVVGYFSFRGNLLGWEWKGQFVRRET